METINPPLPAYRLRIRVWIVLWLLYFYSRWFMYSNYYSRLDNINLIIHEAGHPLMSIFWEVMQFLWGTLFQLMIPTLFFVYFFVRRVNIAWQLCLFWIWENFLNISYYAWDAVDQALPLLGWEHDWAYLLGHMWLLNHARSIESILFIFGSLLIFVALGYLLYDGIRKQPISIGYENE
jgi:hypothetical protein